MITGTLTGMPYETFDVSACNSFGSVVPDLGTMRGARRNQRRPRTLNIIFRLSAFLLHLSAMAFLITRCAIHITTQNHLNVRPRMPSDQVRLLQRARLDDNPSLAAFPITNETTIRT